MNDLIGRQIDTYRIDALLGEGGMGAVYRAYDLNLKRLVAIKLMHANLASQPEFRQRFLQEAQVAAHLGEQNASIIRIYYLGANQDPMYMVQAYVPGGSLADHVRRLQKTGQAVQLREILILMAQVADALGYAHRQGVIHRDIKPSNVLLQRLEEPDQAGDPPLRAIVTDFGLAKLLEGGMQTRSGSTLGTFAYMSPEQTLRKELDGRSDIYSLGVMLYQVTTGRLPLDIQSISDAILKHQQNEMPPAPREIWPGLPESIEAIIQKAIAKRPEDRYQNAETMEQALREAARKITEADVTQFTGQRSVLSLETHLQQSGPIAEPSRMGFDMSPIPYKDRLVIAQKEHTPRSVTLDKAQLTIGRSAENDIVLEHPDVSRQHARLERTTTGWQVTDLKSTNGTYLDGNLLLAGVAEPVLAGKTLRIGPYFLHLQPAESQAAIPDRKSYGEKKPLPDRATQIQTSSGQLEVVLNPTDLVVAPGGRVDAQVELFNQGYIVDKFNLSVDGIPGAWVDMPTNSADLMPGSDAKLTFSIHPPQVSSARAGQYTYKLRVESISNSKEVVNVSGHVTVLPFERFSVDLRPSHLPSGSKTRLSIHNEGNAEGKYSLVGRDPADLVRFEGERGRIIIPPGDTQTVELSINAKKRPPMGSTQLLPFQILLQSESGDSRELAGQLEVKPLILRWMVAAVGVLIALCLTSTILGYFGWFVPWMQSNTMKTATALAENKTKEPPGTVAPQPTNITPQASTTPVPLPGGITLQWSILGDRVVAQDAQKYWEKYQADTNPPGLYLRTDNIDAFGDFLELNPDQTFTLEESGERSTGIWKVDGNKLILSSGSQ
jgi:serine/threonine protein kinase